MLKQFSVYAFVLTCFVIDSSLSVASAGVSGKTYNTEVTLVSNLNPGETFEDLWTFQDDGKLIFFSYLEGEWSEVDLILFSLWFANYSDGPQVQFNYVGIASGASMQGFGFVYSLIGGGSEIGVSTVAGTEAETEAAAKPSARSLLK